jgi:hypothetical protein
MVAHLEPPVTLNVVSENVGARALYLQLGFKVERELRSSFQGRPCNVCKLRYETATQPALGPLTGGVGKGD